MIRVNYVASDRAANVFQHDELAARFQHPATLAQACNGLGHRADGEGLARTQRNQWRPVCMHGSKDMHSKSW
jgi:hypothetical protein